MWVSVRVPLVAIALAVLSLLGCCKKTAEPVAVGSEVEAPWSSARTMQPGHVTELYGKMAHVEFDDGDKGWALVTELDPPGTPGSQPTDTCALKTGQRVMAPWSRTKNMYAGRVGEVYGKLVRVNFDDGDVGWALCAATKPQ